MQLANLHEKDQFNEPVWHVLLAIGAIIGLQLAVSDTLTFGFMYIVVGLEILLLLTLAVRLLPASVKRLAAIALISFISIANIISLAIVIYALFEGGHVNGRQLLLSGVAIFLTNIIVFGLGYWEMDNTRRSVNDFQFPQSARDKTWKPTFFDYLYISITNAVAFSPTDTMPLTHRAKFLMTVQSVASLVTVALVAARAVNILS